MEKVLYRCDNGKMICGVCRGFSEFANVDVSIVRIVWGVLAFTFVGLVAYIIAACVLPHKA